MILRTPSSSLTYPLLPYTPLFRSLMLRTLPMGLSLQLPQLCVLVPLANDLGTLASNLLADDGRPGLSCLRSASTRGCPFPRKLRLRQRALFTQRLHFRVLRPQPRGRAREERKRKRLNSSH